MDLSLLNKYAMIRAGICTVLILTFATVIYGQSNAGKDTCIAAEFSNIDLFIPGSADTIQENGFHVKVINPSDLINGFELKCPDSLVKIIQFRLVFDNKVDGNIYTMKSKGNAILDDEKLFSLSKIKDARLITIEEISFIYKNVCYRAKGQVYLCR